MTPMSFFAFFLVDRGYVGCYPYILCVRADCTCICMFLLHLNICAYYKKRILLYSKNLFFQSLITSSKDTLIYYKCNTQSWVSSREPVKSFGHTILWYCPSAICIFHSCDHVSHPPPLEIMVNIAGRRTTAGSAHTDGRPASRTRMAARQHAAG